MQHFQTSAACVFIWRRVASSTFALRLVYQRAVSESPPLYTPLLLYFTSISFVDIITFAQYSVCEEYLYFKCVEMKVSGSALCH